MRYRDKIEEEMLFCASRDAHSRDRCVLEGNAFFLSERVNVEYRNRVRVSLGDAPLMLGRVNGFAALA